MKLAASLIASLTKTRSETSSIFEQRLEKMKAPVDRPRRAPAPIAPSAFKFTRATA